MRVQEKRATHGVYIWSSAGW